MSFDIPFLLFVGGIAAGALLFLILVMAIFFRIVVPTNEVHIVQSGKETVSFGKDQPSGNTYYKWPSWIPLIGVKTKSMPMSVFSVDLSDYAGYDVGRVPFVVDIMAFFRIKDSNVAAQRVDTFEELLDQLEGILQGAVRSILASSEIEEILEGRSKFGEMFTKAVDDQLAAWGVCSVKAIELMDIRDAADSKVIANIMAKKKSHIEMESRVEVANNMQKAETAEIDAKRAVKVREQEALEQVGIRTAQKDQQVGIATEKSRQQIKDEEKLTTEKTMEVNRVKEVKNAEIIRSVQIVQADQQKQTEVIRAEGEKQKTETIAQGNLTATKLKAEGVQAEGLAKAEAEKALQLAPVQAQITLAKEIGENSGYQQYLTTIRQIEAAQAVGIEQAGALENADVKIIANTGQPVEGLKSVMDLFSSQGGTNIAGMLEALKQSPTGEALLKKVAEATKS